MTHELKEPARLMSSGGDPLLVKVLRAGEAELGTDEQLAAVAARLGPILGASGTGTGAAAGGTKTASTLIGGTAAKVMGVLGIGAALTVSVGYLATRSPTPPSPEGRPSSVIHDPPAPTNVASPAHAPVPKDEGSPPSPSTKPVATARPSNRAAPTRVESAASPSAQIETPDAEVRLLHRAQDSLRGESLQALAICDEHGRRFPNGLLSQEREVIAIEALTRLGRLDDAKTRARRFRKANPSSSHLGRIEVLVGNDF